jgi:hypothetical protein
MLKHIIVTSLGFMLFTQLAHAQLATSQPARLDLVAPGYSPTLFKSKAEVQALYDEMPWSEFKPGARKINPSQCYMRAQLWTYDWYRNRKINAMKVFVFYTHTYKKYYEYWATANKMNDKKFDWWYHVAPYVLVQSPDSQKLEEWVLDPTFAYLGGDDSDKPMDMKSWTDLFVVSKRACKEFVSYKEFQCEVEGAGEDCATRKFGTEHCYIVRQPAPVYDPDQIADTEEGKRSGFDWDYNKTLEAVDKAPAGNKNEEFWRRRIGFPLKN